MKNKIHSLFFQRALWILVVLVSLGQLQRVMLGDSQNWAIYLHELYMVFYMAALWVFMWQRYLRALSSTGAALKNWLHHHAVATSLVGFYCALSAAQLIFTQDLTGLAYLFRLATYLAFGAAVVVALRAQILDKLYTRVQLMAIGGYMLWVGLLQWYWMPDTRFLAALGWDDHYARLIGTVFDPGFTGMLFLMSGLYVLALRARGNFFLRSVRVALLLGFGIGIALTFSRATYLATAAASAVLMICGYFSKKILVVGAIVAVAIVLTMPKPFGEGVDLLRAASVKARAEAVEQQLAGLTPKTLLVGNGLFSYQNSLQHLLGASGENAVIPSHSRMPDNIFMLLLLSFGVGGVIVFCGLYAKAVWQCAKAEPIFASMLVALFVHAQFHNTLLHPFILLFFVWGVATLPIAHGAQKN